MVRHRDRHFYLSSLLVLQNFYYGINMTGHSVFTYHTQSTATTAEKYIDLITVEQYTLWQKEYTLEALRGIRYGQSFCNHFNLDDNLLFYTADHYWCDNYIRKHYLDKR